jgi:hypothetical protein
MSTASGQVAAGGEFAALFTVQSIYSRLVRESERSNKALWLLHYAFTSRNHTRSNQLFQLTAGRIL